jgi:hypothetical protein
MTHTTFATGLLLASCIAAPAAQRTQTPTNEPAHNVFVLTGCLERGDTPLAFRLTRASAVGQTPPRPSTSAAVTKPEDDVYELQATSSVSEQGLSSEKLQPEVGTRVEMTIRPIETALPAPPKPAATNAAEKAAESPRQRYTVIKLERLAGSCK